MGSSWGSDPDSKVMNNYDLRTHWESIRETYSSFSVSFNVLVNKHKFNSDGFKKELREESVETAKEVFQLVSNGLKHLSTWTTLSYMMLTWKYTHPCSLEQMDKEKSDKESDGLEYERVLRKNLSLVERSVLVDVISMVKSLASSMLKAESLLAPFIRFHIHHHIQQLVQGDLTPLLHRLDKRNKPILPSLLKLRSLAAGNNIILI
jgi:cytoplasmic FMR1 interacting protein